MFARGLVTAALLVSILVSMPVVQGLSAGQEQLLAGELTLSRSGQVVGAERFRVAQTGGWYWLISEGQLTGVEGEARWQARVKFSPELIPLEYELRRYTSQGSEVVLANWSEGLRSFELGIYENGNRTTNQSLPALNPVLLDKDIVSHYVALALRLWITGGGGFSALMPQAQAVVPLEVEMDGVAAFRAPWGDEAAQRWWLTLRGEEVLLYEHAGELLWVEVPRLGLSAWRFDLFPKLPQPYRVQTEMSLPPGSQEGEVRFSSDGAELVGTLLLPAGEGKLPAVLFIPGTGAVDRDGSAPEMPAKIFRELAYSLAEAGIASLRYDKRGVGESEGDLTRASFTDLLADALAALWFLRDRSEVGRVFLVGHSAGALQAMLLAQEEEVAGLVLLGAPARPLEEVLFWQMEQAFRAADAPEDRISRELAKLSEFVSFA